MSETDMAKYELIRALRRESRRLCDQLDRDLEVRKGLTREAFRLARFEVKRGEASAASSEARLDKIDE